MRARRPTVLFLLLALAACGGSDGPPGPPPASKTLHVELDRAALADATAVPLRPKHPEPPPAPASTAGPRRRPVSPHPPLGLPSPTPISPVAATLGRIEADHYPLDLATIARGVSRRYGGRIFRLRALRSGLVRATVYDRRGTKYSVEVDPATGTIEDVAYPDGQPSEAALTFRARLSVDEALARAATVRPEEPKVVLLAATPEGTPRYLLSYPEDVVAVDGDDGSVGPP